MQFTKTLAFVLAIIASPIFANTNSVLNNPAGNPEGQAIVLHNATVHTMSDSGTFVGSVVIVDDKIVAVGKSVEIPDGAKVIELDGCHIVPGLIESRGKLWLTTAATGEASSTAGLNVVDGIDAWSEDWQELAAQGITSVYVQPGSNSALGGYGAVLNVGPYDSPDTIVLEKETAVQAAIGISAATSKDRFAQIKALEKHLETAKARKEKDEKKAADEKKKAEEKKKADAKKAGEKKDDDKKESESKKKPAKPADEAKSKDGSESDKPDSSKAESESALQKIMASLLNKEIPLHVEVHHSDAAKQIVAIARKFEIRVVLDGLSHVGSAREAINESGFPLVVGPLFESNNQPAYRKHADFEWLLDESSTTRLWALSGFANSAIPARLLRTQAATAVRFGVEPETALAAVTSNAARILGVADRVGTLEAGKLANIAVFAGDPLNPASPTRLVLSQGQTIFAREATAIAANNNTSIALPARLPSRFAVKTTKMLVKGEFVAATLLVEEGKVVSIGDLDESANVTVFDLQDTVVTPGLVIGHTSLGQNSAIADTMESDASHLRSVDAIDPTTEIARKVLAGGFIHAGLSPGSSNTSSGTVGQLRLGADEYVSNPMIANQFVLAKSARGSERFPSSLNGQVQMINELFEGQTLPSSVYVTSAVSRSIAQEKLANIKSVASGNRKAIIAAESKLEMRSALSLAKRYNFEPAIVSSGRVGDFAEKLAAQKCGLIVPVVNGGEFDSHFAQIIAANEAGVPLAFAGDSAEKIRSTAALLVNAGLSPKAALLGLTEGGASVVGMNNIGLSAGSMADFVVWSDSPLNLSAKPLNVVVDGKPVSTK